MLPPGVPQWGIHMAKVGCQDDEGKKKLCSHQDLRGGGKNMDKLVMGNGHARAQYCPPARYFSHAGLARCPKKKPGKCLLAHATISMPGAPAGKNWARAKKHQ